ncbi:MAG TPA: hypothetical protein VNY31_04110 [Solirubrobacteraceae bacterium]|jgi:hypothetical protein|nr:hypothetical protein [Solirubrobacteraceae bacterium]
MNAHPGELAGRERLDRRAVLSPRWLTLLVVVGVAALGAGFAIGSTAKGGGRGRRSPPALDKGGSGPGGSIPTVPGLRTTAGLPSLRSRSKARPAASSASTGGSAGATSSSTAASGTGTSATAGSSTPAPSVPSTESSASSSEGSAAPKRSAPSHSEGGVVHHESGGGA